MHRAGRDLDAVVESGSDRGTRVQPMDREHLVRDHVPDGHDDVGAAGHTDERSRNLRRASDFGEDRDQDAGHVVTLRMPLRQPRLHADRDRARHRHTGARPHVVGTHALVPGLRLRVDARDQQDGGGEGVESHVRS